MDKLFWKNHVNNIHAHKQKMEAEKFKNYEKRTCKFTFRNGKEVFGVIWKSPKQKIENYYFTSSREFEQIAKNARPLEGCPIKIEDLIHAELIY
ncbi:MAG: hypothetical protein CMP63_06495 [Flavobacteriales bacterium]|nr:hypothetical protein [Flavobacteriales bacterium]